MGPATDGVQREAAGGGDPLSRLDPCSHRRAPDRAEVETGDVAYWPPEDALCLFFGDTTARTDKDSPVASVGRIVAGIEDCKLVRQNETLKIEASQE